jgi:hypothetical protein
MNKSMDNLKNVSGLVGQSLAVKSGAVVDQSMKYEAIRSADAQCGMVDANNLPQEAGLPPILQYPL